MNLEGMSIEELAKLRDRTIAVLADKVAARQKELQDEMERVWVLAAWKRLYCV